MRVSRFYEIARARNQDNIRTIQAFILHRGIYFYLTSSLSIDSKEIAEYYSIIGGRAYVGTGDYFETVD